MIEVKKLNKSFADKHVLFDINSEFLSGKNNIIIGASGCGKSVLLKCLVGLLKPEQGEIFFDKRSILEINEVELREIRKEMGMLFQGTALFDSLNVEENIEFPLRFFSNMSPAERKDRVNFCLERVNMVGVNKKYPSEISGGMKKRVGIARAIALDIKYLFCDEPNSGLDPITSRLIDELINEITIEYQITNVIASHDMKTVFDIGDHILFLHKGAVGWEGSKADFRHAIKEVKELKEFIDASYFE
ncbi:MAG: ATP-binding cassette domain-containing protein [Bacteroidota bacterium]|nr:ATP-binding cassette domain-containing protein [Bacteroidota bacterium]